MSNNIVNNYATTIITIFKDVVEKYEYNLEVIKQSEDELNDLYHEIELSSPKDMYKGYLLYKEIREVRIRRRNAKEQNELLKDMYEYFVGQNAQGFKSKVQSIQGGAVKIQNAQEHRTYQPRQRSDLTITNKHVDANKQFEKMLADFNKDTPYMSGGKMRKR